MGESVPTSRKDPDIPYGPSWTDRFGAVSVDWWATAVAGVIVALAVANVLPKIPW